jgi:hypothetical protein
VTPGELNQDRDDDPADIRHQDAARGPAGVTREQVRACWRGHRDRWVLTIRRRSPGTSAQVTCTAPGCGRTWRTRGAYAEKLAATARKDTTS